jgi:hypothetical protein
MGAEDRGDGRPVEGGNHVDPTPEHLRPRAQGNPRATFQSRGTVRSHRFPGRAGHAALQCELRDTFTLLEDHAAKENRFLDPLIRSCAPRIADGLDSEHREQEERMHDLRDRLARVGGDGADAPATGHAFAVALSRFSGELVVHMADEEEQAMVALWEALDDKGARAGGSPEGWKAMASLARRVLDPADWAALERGLTARVSQAA